jgi:hypothetical protein
MHRAFTKIDGTGCLTYLMEGCLVRKNEELCIIDETTFPAFGGKNY